MLLASDVAWYGQFFLRTAEWTLGEGKAPE